MLNLVVLVLIVAMITVFIQTQIFKKYPQLKICPRVCHVFYELSYRIISYLFIEHNTLPYRVYSGLAFLQICKAKKQKVSHKFAVNDFICSVENPLLAAKVLPATGTRQTNAKSSTAHRLTHTYSRGLGLGPTQP